jgi:hypothetical protein
MILEGYNAKLTEKDDLIDFYWPPVVGSGQVSAELLEFMQASSADKSKFIISLRSNEDKHSVFIQRSLSEIYAYWLGYRDSPLYLLANDDMEIDIISAKIIIEREMLDHWLKPLTPPKILNQVEACEYLRQYIEENSGIYHDFFDYVENEMTRDQMIEFLQFEAVRNEVVDDEVALIVVGLQAQMKNSMTSNLWDECGNGSVLGFHTYWLRQLLEQLGGVEHFQARRSELIPWFTGITSNSFNMMATRPGYKYRAYGSFLITESWVNAHFGRILNGMKRVGLDHPDLTVYFTKHFTIDPHHTDQILIAMENQQPELNENEIREVLWGAHTAVSAGIRLYEQSIKYFMA